MDIAELGRRLQVSSMCIGSDRLRRMVEEAQHWQAIKRADPEGFQRAQTLSESTLLTMGEAYARVKRERKP